MYWELSDILQIPNLNIATFQIFGNTLAVALVPEKGTNVEIRLYDTVTLKLRSTLCHTFKRDNEDCSIDPHYDSTTLFINNDSIVLACDLWTNKHKFGRRIYQVVKWSLLDGETLEIDTPGHCYAINDTLCTISEMVLHKAIYVIHFNKWEKEAWQKIDLHIKEGFDVIALRNQLIAIGTYDERVELWDIDQCVQKWSLPPTTQVETKGTNALHFLKDSILCSMARLGSKLINVADGKIVKEFAEYNNAGVGQDTFILASKRQLLQCDLQGKNLKQIATNNDAIGKITLSPNEHITAIVETEVLKIWSEDAIQRFDRKESYCNKCCFSPDSKTIFCTTGINGIALFKY